MAMRVRRHLVGRGVLDDDPPVDGDERVGQLLGLRAFALALWRPMLKTTSPARLVRSTRWGWRSGAPSTAPTTSRRSSTTATLS